MRRLAVLYPHINIKQHRYEGRYADRRKESPFGAFFSTIIESISDFFPVHFSSMLKYCEIRRKQRQIVENIGYINYL